MTQAFATGQLVVTREVNEKMKTNGEFELDVLEAIFQYRRRDWGATCEADSAMNDEALETGERIVAKYETCAGDIFIITEWDRSVTTILFTYEY